MDCRGFQHDPKNCNNLLGEWSGANCIFDITAGSYDIFNYGRGCKDYCKNQNSTCVASMKSNWDGPDGIEYCTNQNEIKTECDNDPDYLICVCEPKCK